MVRPAGPVRVRPWGRSTVLQRGLVVIGLLAGGCRPQSRTTTELPAAPVRATPGQPVHRLPAAGARTTATARAPIELLPEGTDAVVTVASVQHVLRVFDVAALTAKYRAQYDQAAAYVEQATGHNLLDPRKWPEVGVDPDGPIGVALLDAGAGVTCVFFTLTDSQRFRDFLQRLGPKIGGRLETVYEDRGVVLAHEPGETRALVLRDGFAFYVDVDDPNRAPYDFARELASVDPDRSLAASPRWRQALGPAAARDLVGFLDIAGMVRRELTRRPEEPGPSWAEIELQRLREQGAAADEIARWEQVAGEQRVADARHRERRRREQEMWSAGFGGFGPLVFEFSLDPRAVSGSVRARVPETSLLRRLLARPGAPALAITGAGERVLFGTGVSLDVAEAMAALELVLRADGKDLDGLAAEVKRALGIDLRTAVAAVDGSMSLAVTVKDPRDLATAKSHTALGFNLALGLKDPAAAQALLEALAPKLAPAGLKLRRAGTRGHVVTIPNWRDVHVAVAGSTLAVSTDPEFVRRVERGARGPIEKTLPAAVVPVVSEREAAMVWTLDYLLPVGMYLMGGSPADESWDPTRSQPYWRFPAVEQARIDAVPQSATYKAKLREWRRADAKIRRADEAQQRRRTSLVFTMAESVGAAALNLRETADGLVLTGGQYFGPGGLGRAIESGFGAMNDFTHVDWSIYEERNRLDRELQELRIRDLERALNINAAQ